MLKLQMLIQTTAVLIAGSTLFLLTASAALYIPAFLVAWSVRGLDYAKKELGIPEYVQLCWNTIKDTLTLGGLIGRKK